MSLNKTSKIYDFSANDLIIDGLEITGFGEDGSIQYEFQGNIWEHVSGADGHVAVSRQNDYRVVATVTVMETALGYEYLSELVRKQSRARQIAPGPMPYLHRDRELGEQFKSKECYFLNWPGVEKTRDAGEREFTILLPNAAELFEFAGVGSFSLF